MKVFVMTDLEGPCQVNRWEQTRVSELTPAKQFAMTMLTAEVNAAVDGVLDVDPAATVVVWDGHGSGGIDNAQFHPQAWLLAHGRGIRAPYTLDESYDAQIFIGQHAMAGTPNAPLCHTYSSKTVEYYQINGQRLGEFGCRAYLAGAYGVPTVFLAGDDQASAEARALVPEIVTVDTKVGLGIELALHRPVAQVRSEIRAAVALAVRRRHDIAPAVLAGPYTMESRVLPDCSVDGYLGRNPAVKRLDERTVEWTVEHLSELWI
ncbi:MAG: M55 family metallopeptidase [Fimbriimonadaceae bacterium]|nr:M55 family metallopeptidase [Fimbriimonadaceae bacterium]